GKRSYLCPADNCGKVYKRADFLQKHIRAHDTRESRAARKRARIAPDNGSESSEDAPLAVVARQANRSDHEDTETEDEEAVFARPQREAERLLEAKLSALRGEVEQRQQLLEDIRVKTRRVRLENDIIIDALERG
ncbi:hypothetical protein DL89DRAFT_226526, partial [Linderina pennispora]